MKMLKKTDNPCLYTDYKHLPDKWARNQLEDKPGWTTIEEYL